MARITVEGCLDKVESRFELILLASGRARQLSTTSREPMVEWEDDKPTIVALREIEEGLITKEILDKTLEEDVLLDEFSIDREKPPHAHREKRNSCCIGVRTREQHSLWCQSRSK